MARALVSHGELPVPGDPVFLDGKSLKRAGTVINAVGLPSGGGELLATLPLPLSVGTEFSLGQAGRSIQLVELPPEASKGES